MHLYFVITFKSLCYLFFFDLLILITPFVSSKSSYNIYLYVWKLNQTALELDFWVDKCICFY
jgi:hypothetical protein